MLALRVDGGLAGTIDHVELHVYRPDEGAPRLEHCFPAGSCVAAGAEGVAAPLAPLPELPGTLALYPESQANLGTPVLVVFEGKQGGVTKISRRARMSFVKEKSKLLRLDLSASCLPIDCSKAATGQEDLTCAGGHCVPTTVDNPDGLPDFTDTTTALDPSGFSGAAGAAGMGGAGMGGAEMGGAGGAGMGGAGMGGEGGAEMGGAGQSGAGQGGAGQGGAGMGGAGMAGAGMAGACAMVPTVKLEVMQEAPDSLGSGEPVSFTITVNGGTPPFDASIEMINEANVPFSLPLGAIGSSAVFSGKSIDLCGQVKLRAKIHDAVCGDVVSAAVSQAVAASGPQVSTMCVVGASCGSVALPHCLVSEAIKQLDTERWTEGVKVAVGTYTEATSISMRDGVSVTGGYSLDFSSHTEFKAQAEGEAKDVLTLLRAGTEDQTIPSVPVILWPASAKPATLADLRIQPFEGAIVDVSKGVSISPDARATLRRVRVDARNLGSSMEIFNHPSIGLAVEPEGAVGSGELVLDQCAVQTPTASCPPMVFCGSKAVSVSAVGSFGVTIKGGNYTAMDISGDISTHKESVGVEVGLEKGQLTIDEATIVAGSTSGNVSVGLRILSGSGATITGGSITTGSRESSAVADGVRIGVDPLELSDPAVSFSLPAQHPLQGSYVLQAGVDPAGMSIVVPAVFSGGTGRAVAFFSGGQPASLRLSGCDLRGPQSIVESSFQVQMAGRAIGLLADGSKSPPAAIPKVTVDNTSTPAATIVGGWGTKQQIGALVNDVIFEATNSSFQGSPTSLPAGLKPTGGSESKGIVLRQVGLQGVPATITGGTITGGLVNGTQNPGDPAEAIGIEVDLDAPIKITMATVSGCAAAGCQGNRVADRAVAVRLLRAKDPEISRCILLGGDLDSAGLMITGEARPTSAGVVVEPVLLADGSFSGGVQGILHVEDNSLIKGGKAYNSYGVVAANLLALPTGAKAMPAPPPVSILRNFVSPGGLSRSVAAVCPGVGQPRLCKSSGVDIQAESPSLVVNNVILGGTGDFSQALHVDVGTNPVSTLIAYNLLVGQGNAGPGDFLKVLSLEGSKLDLSSRIYLANNLLVPAGQATALTAVSLSGSFLQTSQMPSDFFRPLANQVVQTSNAPVYVLWGTPGEGALSADDAAKVLDSPFSPLPTPTPFDAAMLVNLLDSAPKLPASFWDAATCQSFFQNQGRDLSGVIPPALHMIWAEALATDLVGAPRSPMNPTTGPLEACQ